MKNQEKLFKKSLEYSRVRGVFTLSAYKIFKSHYGKMDFEEAKNILMARLFISLQHYKNSIDLEDFVVMKLVNQAKNEIRDSNRRSKRTPIEVCYDDKILNKKSFISYFESVDKQDYKLTLDILEKKLIIRNHNDLAHLLKTIRTTDTFKACQEELGISKKTFYKKYKKLRDLIIEWGVF